MADGEKGLSLREIYLAGRVLCVVGILASNLLHSLQASVVEGVIDLPQPPGEGIRADELSTLVGELDYSAFFDRMSISGGRREADTRSCQYEA